MSKVCAMCRKVVPSEGFSKDRRNTDGLRGNCRECMNVHSRAYRIEHKDRLRVYSLTHYRENKAYYSNYRLEHRAERQEYDRAYRLEHIEEKRAYDRAYRKANPCKTRAKNPDTSKG